MRSDLAEAELKEANLLAAFVPPTMAREDVDRILGEIFSNEAIGTVEPRRAKGMLLKAFYARVDKSAIDGQLVKQRVDSLLSTTD